jgi:renalase
MIFDVIVIGAGLSGSFLASKLKDQGKRVLIIEKSRGVGGRCSTKPIEKNIVDYGCQYFKPKSNSAINILNNLVDQNILERVQIKKNKEVLISPLGMNRVPQYFARNVPVLTNTKANLIKRENDVWLIKTNTLNLESKTIVSSIPTNQNIELFLKSDICLGDNIFPKVSYHSFFTITCMNKLVTDTILQQISSDFSWICNNTLKGLRNEKYVYTINTSKSFTKRLLTLNKKDAEKEIREKLNLIGIKHPKNLSIHFWKYAYSDSGSNEKGYWNNKISLGLCGDGFGLGKIDGALTSADFLSKKII